VRGLDTRAALRYRRAMVILLARQFPPAMRAELDAIDMAERH
jgi:hypothetical protein